MLPEYRVAAQNAVDISVQPAIDTISIIYLAGCLIALAVLLVKLVRTIRKQQTQTGFSFLKRVIVNPDLESKTYSAVEDHENVHARKLHSIDIVLVEVLGVLWWFNPLLFLLKREIRMNHEFEADSVVSKVHEDYSKMLVSQYLQVDQSLLGHSFSMSNLKKRLIMMNQSRKSSVGKHIVFGVLCAGAVALASWGPVANFEETPQEKVAEKSDLDTQPQFPGGQEALMNFMMENVKYPSSAKKAGVEGKVMVSFIVAKSGEVTSVSVMNPEVDGDLQKEALRVVKKMPNWTPGTIEGKATNAKMVLPIMFKLPPEE